jgi:hypothetical protein
MDFFASLRLMLAYSDLERLNLGVVAHEFIRNEAIPKVQKMLESSRMDNEIERYTALLEAYETYSDPKTTESRIYSKTAANIVRQLAQRSRIDDNEMEDLMQNMAVAFFKPGEKSGTDLRRAFNSFDIKGGPLALNKLWAHIVDLNTQYHIREAKRKNKEILLDRQENDEGEELDPISQLRAPPEAVDEDMVEEVTRELPKYVYQKVKSEKARAMFDIWFDLAQKHVNMVEDNGLVMNTSVNMKREVFPALRDRGYEGNEGTMSDQWMALKHVIFGFFRDLGSEYVPFAKSLLKVGAVDSLTRTMYHRRLSAWMLGGVFRGMLEAEAEA